MRSLPALLIFAVAACGAPPDALPNGIGDGPGGVDGGGGAGGGTLIIDEASGAGGGGGNAFGTAPAYVVSNRPGAGTVDAATNTTLGVTLTEGLDSATVNSNTFTLTGAGRSIPGTVSVSGKTATFNPSVELAANTLFTATLSTGVKSLSGQPLTQDFFWFFRTGSSREAPSVISTTPGRAARSVGPAMVISATFSTSLDWATLNARTFRVEHDGMEVDGVVGYSGGTATFTPANGKLEPLTAYDVVLAGMTDRAGVPLPGGFGWSFVTADSQD